MTSVIAAALLVILGVLGVLFVAHGATKPPDSFDMWGVVICVFLVMAGIGRLFALAFI